MKKYTKEINSVLLELQGIHTLLETAFYKNTRLPQEQIERICSKINYTQEVLDHIHFLVKWRSEELNREN